MMNINEEDVDLGLRMSSTKISIRTRLLSTSGAGVNADSRVNLAIPTSDLLSELVWSPHNGVSLKCATSRAADNKPLLMWNVGPSSPRGLSPLHSTRLKKSGDEAVVDDMIIEKVAWLEASESRHTPDLDDLESDRVVEEEENCIAEWEMDSCHPQNVQPDGIAEISQEIAELCKEEVPSVATGLKKSESSAENVSGNALPAEGLPTSSRNCLYLEKGKGKVLSDGDIYGRSSHDDDDSHDGSAGSCNSARLSSKGTQRRKRQMYDQGVLVESKRMKNKIHGSTYITRPYSSFMNWISNMTNVSPLTLASPNIDAYGKNGEDLVCFRPQDTASIGMGFQTIFKPMHCTEKDKLNSRGKRIAESAEESRESTENLHESCDRNCGNSTEHTILCSKEVNPIVASKPCLLSSYLDLILCPAESNLARNNALEDVVSDRGKDGLILSEMNITAKEAYVLEESNPLNSAWITRLFPRPEKGKGTAEETNMCSTPSTKAGPDSLMNVVYPIQQKSSGTRDESAPCLKISSNRSVPTSNKMQGSPASMWTKDVSLSQKAVAQSQLFDAIRNLQLTRTDILRWMDKNFSLSNFNGFFVRLRLGKHEAGLGSSGYYVACITGDARENDGSTSKKTILVDVGGIKSSVSCQYVSNHDFLEDEIKAWFCRTVDSGCRIPSIVELKSKFNDRKTLCF